MADLSATTLAVSAEEGIQIIEIDRPHCRNAVDANTARQLYEAFREFDRHPEMSVAVLHGKGMNFCAGADLKAIAAGQPNPVGPEAPHAPMGPTHLELSKPVIAAIEGYAVAGGLELALWCDLRVASSSAVFGVFCRRFGVPLVDGGSVRLPRLIGHGRAMDLILTGRAVSAEEALAWGLITQVCPPGRSLDHALALARTLKAMPQSCLRNDRRSLILQAGLSEREALRQETRLGLLSLASGEAREGAKRFSRQRPGPASGRNDRDNDQR